MQKIEKELPEVYQIISRDHTENGKNSAVSQYIDGGCMPESAEPVLELVKSHFKGYEMPRLLDLYRAVWDAHQISLLTRINFSNRKIREEARKHRISYEPMWPAKLVDVEEISLDDPDVGSAITEILSVLMKMREMETFLKGRVAALVL